VRVCRSSSKRRANAAAHPTCVHRNGRSFVGRPLLLLASRSGDSGWDVGGGWRCRLGPRAWVGRRSGGPESRARVAGERWALTASCDVPEVTCVCELEVSDMRCRSGAQLGHLPKTDPDGGGGCKSSCMSSSVSAEARGEIGLSGL
jgi:hypothetical protein